MSMQVLSTSVLSVGVVMADFFDATKARFCVLVCSGASAVEFAVTDTGQGGAVSEPWATLFV